MLLSDPKIGPAEGARPPAGPPSESLFARALVAAATGLPEAALSARRRGPPRVARARQLAMYLAHVGFGATLSEIGRGFGRDRTTVAHACAAVEDRRDDPSFDRLVASLEGAASAWGRCFLGSPPRSRRGGRG